MCAVCRTERRFRLKRGSILLAAFIAVFALVVCVSASEVRIHNATSEALTIEGIEILPGAVVSVVLPTDVLNHSRTNTAGQFEAWAVDVDAKTLVSLRPGGEVGLSRATFDSVEVFKYGFLIGCLWELMGLTIRIVRNITGRSTSV